MEGKIIAFRRQKGRTPSATEQANITAKQQKDLEALLKNHPDAIKTESFRKTITSSALKAITEKETEAEQKAAA